MTLHNLLIDKRIVQRNLEQGKLEAGEYKRFLDALPDLSDKLWRKPAATEEPRTEAVHTNAAASAAQSGARTESAARTESTAQAGAAQTEPTQSAPAVAPANAEAVANAEAGASAARNDVVPAFDASL